MFRLCVIKPFPDYAPERLGDFGGAYTFTDDPTNADVILGQPALDLIGQCKSLKWLQIPSAGADHYARHPEVFAGGIRLTTVSGAFGQSISEWTLALAFSLFKHLNVFRDNQNQKIWRDAGRQDSPSGKNVLVLGCGDLGSSIARLFKRFDCHTEGIRRHTGLKIPDGFDAVYGLDGLDARLCENDIIIGALPGTDETAGLLNARRLSLVKSDAIIINVGRGSLIDSDALSQMLTEGKIGGAALDVTNPEPLPPEHPLWTIPSCIITPHASGGSFGHLTATEDKIYEICRENLGRFIKGEPLLNELDFATGYRRDVNRYGG